MTTQQSSTTQTARIGAGVSCGTLLSLPIRACIAIL
jgi:hypothetical protein